MVDPSPKSVPGHSLYAGRYKVIGELGRGASATVYDAHDEVLCRRVALKVLRTAAADRFRAEAELTRQLEHPYIVPIHDFGIAEDERPYIVMKRVRGRTLRDAISADDLGPVVRRLRVLKQIVEAVAFAHQRGIYHRDLKPENVMLDEHGQTLVMDWGLVRATQTEGEISWSERPRTLVGSLLGTPGYMPPEAFEGHRAGPAQDVFALGVIMWEVLIGASPWRGQSLADLAFEAGRPPVPPASLGPDLRQVITRCLHPDATSRFEGGVALSTALQAISEGTTRRARAAQHLTEAQRLMEALLVVEKERNTAEDGLKDLEAELPRWRPLQDRLPLHEARGRAEALAVQASETFGSLVAAAERALSQDPESEGAREVLKQAWWRRFEQAERDRDLAGLALCRQRVVALGGAAARARLEAPGALSLQTDPPGAEVWCSRVQREGLIWPLGEPVLLGRTPLTAVEVEAGSYQLLLKSPGKRDTPYPVLIERGGHHALRHPIRLLTDDEIGGEGWVYVPAGWTWLGGDPDVGRAQLPRECRWVDGFILQRHPVTVREYGRFLQALHSQDPAEARRRLPRHDAVEHGRHQPYWLLNNDGSLPDPLLDNEGDPWDLDWPIVGIDWDDARTFCAWSKGSLPTEAQWERAFRGADARRFPWGDQFDANLCWMGWSFQRGRSPKPVHEVRHDVSVFGASHGAGLIREWTAGADFDGDDTCAAIRGGGWSSTLRAVRLANRFGALKSHVLAHIGVRACWEFADVQKAR